MNPWWLRPPAEEEPSKDKKAPQPASKTPETRQPQKQEKKAISGERSAGRKRGTKRRRSPADKGQRKGPSQRRIAVFYDVEGTEPQVDVEPIFRRLAGQGRLIVKKAYGDWQRHGDLKQVLHQAGMEVVELPRQHAAGPAGAGIKLAVDAVDLCISKDPCEVFVLITGNVDFAPLVAKLQEADIEVVGVGGRESVASELTMICDQFLDIDELLQPAAPPPVEGLGKEKEPLFALLVRTIEALESQGEGTIWGSTLKQEMRRQQPEFDIQELGYATFSDLLEDAERQGVLHLERDDRSGSYYVTGLARQ